VPALLAAADIPPSGEHNRASSPVSSDAVAPRTRHAVLFVWAAAYRSAAEADFETFRLLLISLTPGELPVTRTYSFSLDPAEAVRATQAVLKQQRGFYGFHWMALGALAAFGFFVFVLGVPWQTVWIIGAVALLFFAVEVVTPLLLRRAFRRTFAETPALQHPQVYSFDETGLRISGGPAVTALGWDGIVRVVETEEFFLLFYSKQCAYFLPKRAIDGSSGAHLREVLHHHLGARATLA
jgi:hypothetical protein